MSWSRHVSCALGQRFPNYNGSQAAEQECVHYGAMTGFCLARDQKKPVEFQVDSSKAPSADCKICTCAWPTNRYDAEMTYFLSTLPSHFAGSPGVFTMGQLAGEVALTALGGCSAAICAGSMSTGIARVRLLEQLRLRRCLQQLPLPPLCHCLGFVQDAHEEVMEAHTACCALFQTIKVEPISPPLVEGPNNLLLIV